MSSANNPLIIPILDILRETEDVLSEHELITRLKQQLESLPVSSQTAQLALFQTHFLVMNALFQLQQRLWEDDVCLSISPLAIFLKPGIQGDGGELVEQGVDEQLRSYYLDMNNLRDTSADEVDALLSGFWQHYLAHDKQLDAFEVLGLGVDSNWPQVQGRYRSLAAQHHPDRNGCPEQFMRVREAYEILAMSMKGA